MDNFDLKIQDLCIAVEQQQIINNITLNVKEGELHVLLGANGCGKSSLLSAIMGLPPFAITAGEIHYRQKLINQMSINERAQLGIGMTFQRPPAIEGVKVSDFVKLLPKKDDYQKYVQKLDLTKLNNREVNVGFSGGEIKRWEVLKVFLQDPQLLLFDEPESGVDLEHIKVIGEAISQLMDSKKVVETGNNKHEVRRSALIITHTGFILDYIKADIAHIMIDGRVVHSGEPSDLFKHIKTKGYVLP